VIYAFTNFTVMVGNGTIMRK